ncbi:type II toxin-antitoxin system RelE family toxin [Candidatus Ruthia endofausta]|uniref:type II toxin-antitoxin system RelE family toxin n=1 Tax=Candidatus Ruthia endofausta TaxID=2738852 RepID=UPI0030F8EFC8
MIYKLLFDDKVVKDLKKIDKHQQKKILHAIRTKLTNNPNLGKRLIGELSPYFRMRIGSFIGLFRKLSKNK